MYNLAQSAYLISIRNMGKVPIPSHPPKQSFILFLTFVP